MSFSLIPGVFVTNLFWLRLRCDRLIIVFLVSIFFITAPIISSASSAPPKIIFNNQAKSRSYTNMPASVFPHDLHEKILKCAECHPKPFKKKIGANPVNMKENMEGKYCGKCHDAIISFGMAKCDVCHKKP